MNAAQVRTEILGRPAVQARVGEIAAAGSRADADVAAELDADLREINDAASKITVHGARLPEEVLKLTNQ